MKNEIAVFASRFNVHPRHAHVLPAMFERCAQMTGLGVRVLIAEATWRNRELGEYIASVAEVVAEGDKANG